MSPYFDAPVVQSDPAPPSRTQFDHLRARRTDAVGDVLLADALARLHAGRRSRRGSLVGLPSRAPNPGLRA